MAERQASGWAKRWDGLSSKRVVSGDQVYSVPMGVGHCSGMKRKVNKKTHSRKAKAKYGWLHH